MTDDPRLPMLLLPDVPEGDDAERIARERALVRLRAVSAAEIPVPHRPRRRLALLGVAGSVAIAAAAILAVTSGLDEGRVAPAESSAASVLRQTAAAAERVTAPTALAPGEYLYVRRTAMEPRNIDRGGQRFTVYVRYVNEDWTARDGSGRNRSAPAPPAFPTAADREAWRRAGSPSTQTMVGNYMPIMGDTDFRAPAYAKHAFPARAGGRGLSYRQIRALPTDEQRLERLLRRQVGSVRMYTPETRDGIIRTRVLEWIGRLLGGAPLRADQRAALLRVAAAQPGVRISRDAVDRLNRRGTAVRLDATVALDPSRPPYQKIVSRRSATLVVDPSTGALLGTRTTQGAADGRVVADQGAVYGAAIVSSATTRP